MSLTLYLHPLSSYCHKVLIALYENETPFERVQVDLGNERSRGDFLKVWPIGKFPVIKDGACVVAESSIVIEYLDQHYPGKTRFIPADPDRARETRMRDRFFDLHVHTHMQKIVGDRLRPDGGKDRLGVEQARAQMKTALDLIEKEIRTSGWMMGDEFSLADCSAAPALFYANKVATLAESHPKTLNYLERLMARPSYARTLKEAEPYFQFFPKE